jgi:hypothetical protein
MIKTSLWLYLPLGADLSHPRMDPDHRDKVHSEVSSVSKSCYSGNECAGIASR